MRYMRMSFAEAKDILRGRLSEHRFRHSLGVMELCGELAERNGIDREQAETAGLLHDAAKFMTGDQLIDYCRARGYEPDGLQLASPHLLHGPAGAFMAREDFGVEDQDILNAIEFHTYGRPAMSRLELLVFCADLCEPGRTYAMAEELRGRLRQSLADAVPYIIDRQIEYNLAKGVDIYPATYNMRDYYKNHGI